MKNLHSGLILLCLLFFFSCQKEETLIQEDPVITTEITLENIIADDPLMDKFFNGINDHDIPVSADKKETIDRIKLAMIKDHKTTPFVEGYIREVGFPLWGQAKLHQQGSGNFVYALPFAKKTSTFTTAILHVASINEKFVYELALRTDVKEYMVAYNTDSQTFYWENLLGFLAGFNTYDENIFGFSDSFILEWLNQNQDTYLVDAADTRECSVGRLKYCQNIYALDERGDERSSSCGPSQIEVAIVIVVCESPTGGGGSPSVPIIGDDDNRGGGGSPSDGGSSPGDSPTFEDLLCNIDASISFFQTYNIEPTAVLRDALGNIAGCEGMSQGAFNREAIISILEEYDIDFDSGIINHLLITSNQTLSEITDFLSNNDDNYSIASVNIHTNLKVNNLLSANVNNLNPSQLAALSNAFDNALTGTLSEHKQISAETWLKIAQTENDHCPDCGWLESIRKSLNEGWNEVFKPFKEGLQSVFANLGNAIPGADEEWAALLTVYGPMLTELGIDIGTDFIPGVGEMKSFYKCSNAYAEGKYGEAALEFIGGIAGILPIGDLLKATGSIVDTGVKVFAAYKVIKAIANVSSGIFSKISNLAGQGWKFVWDDGLKKLIFRNPNLGGDVFEMTVRNIDGVDVPITNIKKANGWSLFGRAEIENLTPVSPGGTNGNYFNKPVLNQNSRRIQVTEPADIANLSQAIRNGDPDGLLTEELADKMFREIYPDNTGRIWGNGASHNNPAPGNGLDNLVQLPDGILVIAECKPLSSSGTISLGTPSSGTQMSTNWIYDAADKMTQTSNPSLQSWGNIVKNAIENNTPIERVLIAVDKNTGDILITKLNVY